MVEREKTCMYIEVRKVKNKGVAYGGYKSVEPIILNSDTDEPTYSYKFSDDYFERPNITYKFIAKHSYREKGKVKSIAAYVCCYTWSDFIDGYADAYITTSRKMKIQEKLHVDNSEMDKLLTMFADEVDRRYTQIDSEFSKSQEYIVGSKVNQQVDEYKKRISAFEEKYGNGTYCKVRDFYGELRNEKLMKKLESDYIKKCEYEKESHRHEQERWNNYYKQYSQSGSNQLSGFTGGYKSEEKVLLKKFYRCLSQKYHPDSPDGTTEAMTLINKLKQQWEV